MVVEVPSQRSVLAKGVPASQALFCNLRRRREVHDLKRQLEALFVAIQIPRLRDHSRDDWRPRTSLAVVHPHSTNVVGLRQDVLRVRSGRRP